MNDVKKRVEYGDVNDNDSIEYLHSLTLNFPSNVLGSNPNNKTLISLIDNGPN